MPAAGLDIGAMLGEIHQPGNRRAAVQNRAADAVDAGIGSDRRRSRAIDRIDRRAIARDQIGDGLAVLQGGHPCSQGGECVGQGVAPVCD